jgi:hypothetical protein
MGCLLRQFPLAAFSLFLEDLEAPDLFCGHVVPRNAEMRRIELQLEQPLEQPPSMGVRAGVIEVIEPATRAAVHCELPTAALRAGARRVRVFRRTPEPTLPARDIPGIGAAARTARATITEILGVDRAMNQ